MTWGPKWGPTTTQNWAQPWSGVKGDISYLKTFIETFETVFKHLETPWNRTYSEFFPPKSQNLGGFASWGYAANLYWAKNTPIQNGGSKGSNPIQDNSRSFKFLVPFIQYFLRIHVCNSSSVVTFSAHCWPTPRKGSNLPQSLSMSWFAQNFLWFWDTVIYWEELD